MPKLSMKDLGIETSDHRDSSSSQWKLVTNGCQEGQVSRVRSTQASALERHRVVNPTAGECWEW